MAETIFLSLEDLKSLFKRTYLESNGLDPAQWEKVWDEYVRSYAWALEGKWRGKFEQFFERVRQRK